MSMDLGSSRPHTICAIAQAINGVIFANFAGCARGHQAMQFSRAHSEQIEPWLGAIAMHRSSIRKAMRGTDLQTGPEP
jgi:hypothetical protein